MALRLCSFTTRSMKSRFEGSEGAIGHASWWLLHGALATFVAHPRAAGTDVARVVGSFPIGQSRGMSSPICSRSEGSTTSGTSNLCTPTGCHASAKTTLDTYSHLWPDTDDSTRAAIDAVLPRA